MMSQEQRFLAALQRFDEANCRDPNRVTLDGKPIPKELLYAQRMTQRLNAFAPDASEAVQLAARCQHIMRWSIPRKDFPMDRAGYHRWRTTLANFHADKAAEILRQVGYDEPTIARVQSLVRKEKLKADPETQLLEDVICLVFLEHYFAEFAAEHDEEKLLNILRRTWAKMSPRGREAALKLNLPARARELITKALAA